MKVHGVELSKSLRVGASADAFWRMLAMVACFGFWFFLPNTQFRIGSVGVSELFGVLAVAVVVVGSRVRLPVEVLAAFLLHGVLTLFTFSTALVADSSLSADVRDVVAVTYSIAVAVAIVSLMTACKQALHASVIAMALCVCMYLLVLLGALSGNGQLSVWFLEADDSAPEVDVFSDTLSALPRFVGFSQNPNQLAFFILFCLFFFVATVRYIGVRRWGAIVVALSLISVGLVFSTQSDAGLLTLVAWMFLYAAVAIFRRGGGWAVLTVYVVLVSVGLMLSWVWDWGLGDDAGGQRLPLWISALEIIDDAAGVGLGYGAHIPSMYGRYEAHSLPFDLALYGGFFGMGFLVVAAVRYMYEVFFGKQFRMAILAVAMLVFCLTYSPMRNPVFWIGMFLPFFSVMKPNKVST